MEVNDRVKQKHTKAIRTGIIIGIWEKDEYIKDKNKNQILFACKGEYKVKFDNETGQGYVTFSEQELIKL